MRRGVFGHAVTRRRRGVNYQLIGCFGLQRARLRGWLRNCRTRCGRRRSRQLLAEFHQTSADEKTVDEESDSDQERDYSCHPQPTNDLRINAGFLPRHNVEEEVDRKSTRLNSSHLGISYAVFCLKKKKKKKQ